MEKASASDVVVVVVVVVIPVLVVIVQLKDVNVNSSVETNPTNGDLQERTLIILVDNKRAW